MMRLNRQAVLAALALLLSGGLAPSAIAGQRTFVSGSGSDGNAGAGCTLPLPCRTFGTAIGQTAAGGEVVVLDSAGYGPVTITQSVSIIAPPGVYAGISVASGNGITVNAGASDTVVLRGLAINGLGGTRGLVVNSAATVDLGHIEISGFSSDGIAFNGGGRLLVRESIVRRNAGGGLNFVPAAAAFLTIERSSFDSNNFGVKVSGPGTASVVGASVTENLTGGIVASAGAIVVVADTRVAKTPDPIAYGGIWSTGAGSNLQATRCEVSGYGISYFADAGGQMQLADSVAMGYPNGAGVNAEGAGSTVDVERTAVNRFVIGFYANGGGILRISASTATAVGTSMLAEFGGVIYTRQNNMSASGTSGTITPLPPI